MLMAGSGVVALIARLIVPLRITAVFEVTADE
jgi:hypothetical protein